MTFTPSFRVQDITFDDEVSVSMASSQTSDIIAVPGLQLSIQAVYTGSASGTLRLQYSLDKTNWSDVAGTVDSISGSDNTIWVLVNMAVPYMRVKYDKIAGAGTLTLKACSKSEL